MLSPNEIEEMLKVAFFIGVVVVASIAAGIGIAIGLYF